MPIIIEDIKATEILTSRGSSTMEVCLQTAKGRFSASVPSGVSRGAFEAKQLDTKSAIYNVSETIGPAVLRKEFSSQKELDDFLIALDKTPDKSNLGANAILAVSMAACRAFAGEKGQELFQYINKEAEKIMQGVKLLALLAAARSLTPCFNILEGGRHAQNNLSVQEFMVVPQFDSFGENYRAGQKIYSALRQVLFQKFGEKGVRLGLESGFAPALEKTGEALDFLQQAVKQAGYENKAMIGLDIAASELYQDGFYQLDGRKTSGEELLSFYEELTQKYPILFLEDPFSQIDFVFWQKLKIKNLKLKIIVVGDDLTTTNTERIKMAKEQNLCDGVIIKPNQIGTVTETLQAVKLAKSYFWKIIVSHRAGETEDSFIADLAAGAGAGFIKAGGLAQPERLAKYNRLLEIEKALLKRC
ncbi:MAG: phosphopyruvate hydratase [Patescibacteria group bacterium]|nr:phosphopyruvate hydratase [Patescibacteria group bacterium]